MILITFPDTSNHGRFNLVVSGSAITGITDDGTPLAGSVSGNNVTVTISGVQVATGIISGNNISGTYSFTHNEITYTGTWEASICQ